VDLDLDWMRCFVRITYFLRRIDRRRSSEPFFDRSAALCVDESSFACGDSRA